MKTWFIADTHFGEQPRTRQRASGLSAEQLDDLIYRRWQETVAEDDTIWHLGDIGDWRRLAALPGTKHIVFGNNDRARRAISASGIFTQTCGSKLLEIGSRCIMLIHDPAEVEHDAAIPVIHGHLHHKESPGANFVSVSVDRWEWSPANAESVLSLLDRA